MDGWPTKSIPLKPGRNCSLCQCHSSVAGKHFNSFKHLGMQFLPNNKLYNSYLSPGRHHHKCQNKCKRLKKSRDHVLTFLIWRWVKHWCNEFSEVLSQSHVWEHKCFINKQTFLITVRTDPPTLLYMSFITRWIMLSRKFPYKICKLSIQIIVPYLSSFCLQ